MARQQEKLYDYIIVTKDDEYYGAVSIKNLLLKLLEIQVSIAKFQSPLTGLPGNLMIEEKLKALIQKNQFSVLYFDLDNFKPYNDIYGFNEGDGVIQETANIITRNVQRFGRPTDFVGHIGGDDFVAILDHYEFDILCQGILDEFNEKVKGFYNETDLRRGYVFCQNRRGVVETFPLLSLSIAVVTNRNKKYYNIEDVIREAAITKGKCKVIMGSCCCTN
nr:GGDEF domain-containing protein [Alkaliphilus hydrothermalis]